MLKRRHLENNSNKNNNNARYTYLCPPYTYQTYINKNKHKTGHNAKMSIVVLVFLYKMNHNDVVRAGSSRIKKQQQ